jgi:hypothetical protein
VSAVGCPAPVSLAVSCREQRLEGQRLALARHEHIGDMPGVRRKRRIIKALESEARSIDRMSNALRRRLSQDLRLKS